MSTVPLHRITTTVVPIRPAPALLASADLSGIYFPRWGLLYSLLIHGTVVIGIFYFSVSLGPLRQALPPRWPNLTNQLEMRVVMYLPLHGGGDQAPGLKGGAMEAPRAGPPTSRASSSKGMTYPGPQPIVSDLPKPTNRIQTILQPKLVNPTILTPPVPLPNIIQITDAGPDPQLVNPETKPAAPLVQAPEPPPPVSAARLVLPAAVSPMLLPRVASRTMEIASAPAEDMSRLFEADPQPEPPVQPKAEPLPETSGNLQARRAHEFSPVPTRGNDPRNLLVLTPLPALPDSAVVVPPGEARGRFAISPEPEPVAAETEPGTKTGTPSPAVGLGTQPGASTGNSVPVVTVTFGPSVGPGTGAGSSGKGTGTDTARGAGTGSGPGTGTGSGAGAGSGPGKGPFSGITIVGGVGGTGASGNSPPPAKPAPRPLQTTYGLYVVSTEDSGGGLPYYGVFSHEQVYTVYLDMRKTETDTAPNWTLEFAVLQGTAAQVNPPENSTETHQGIVLPFPTAKEMPAWPSELVRQHLGKLVVVYAVINAEGKMERLSVKGSPDWQLNEPLLKALEKWTFRPAVLNGTPVSVKVLLGIPLWLPE